MYIKRLLNFFSTYNVQWQNYNLFPDYKILKLTIYAYDGFVSDEK